MVTTAGTYRHFAEECLRWAEETEMRLATNGLNGELHPSSASPKGSSYQRSDNPEIALRAIKKELEIRASARAAA
jgi:hypothetical protein